jgi:cell division protein FtsB
MARSTGRRRRDVSKGWGAPPRGWWIRVALAASLAVALAFVPTGIRRSDADRHLERLEAEVADTRLRIAELDEENRELRGEIRGLADDPRAIEDRARRDLGMVYPGELVIQLEEPIAAESATR